VELNLYAAWIAFLCGCIAGAIPGMFFHGADWLGGYASWPRRMIRLGHISMFGLGLLNLAFALTARTLGVTSDLGAASVLLVVGVVAMPSVCYLSAWRTGFRHLFFVPVLSVTLGVALTLLGIVQA
jgi:hypothetical protein